jgi:hypothetical protein
MLKWFMGSVAVALAAVAVPAVAQHPVLPAPEGAPSIQLTPKHMMILRPGLDAIWGSYVFAVQNTGSEPASLSTEIMLPKETVDFQPQEGVKPEELSLSDAGVRVNATFPNGVHIVSIGFKVDARFGGATLTLTPPTEVQSFTLLVPRSGGVEVKAPGLVVASGGDAPDPQYQAYVNQGPISPAQAFKVEIAGLPEGRHRLWLLGGVAAAVLLLGAGFFAWRTRPQLAADESAIVG